MDLFGNKKAKVEVAKHEEEYTYVKKNFDIIYISKTILELKTAFLDLK